MSLFSSAIVSPSEGADSWHFVAYDQLNLRLLPKFSDPHSLGLIFIETSWKAEQLPYHKQKLALLLSNQRHFALEMHSMGLPIKYIFIFCSPDEQR